MLHLLAFLSYVLGEKICCAMTAPGLQTQPVLEEVFTSIIQYLILHILSKGLSQIVYYQVWSPH